MDDIDIKNHSWKETKERLADVYQSSVTELLEGMEGDSSESPHVERTRYELIFMRFANTDETPDESILTLFEEHAETHQNAFCRRLMKATLAICSSDPTMEHLQALQDCAEEARSHKVREHAQTLLEHIE